MKNLIAAVVTAAFTGIVVSVNLSSFEGLSLSSLQQDPAILQERPVILFATYLALLACYLLVSVFRKSEVSKAVEKDANSPVAAEADQSKDHAEVLYFLSLLQEKGRLLDFVMDDVAPYSDEQVGQVARVVHQGVREALSGTIEIETLHKGEEGDMISVDEQYSSQEYRFVGSLKEKPPFSVKVLHRGWNAKKVSMPSRTTSSSVVQPVELEVTS